MGTSRERRQPICSAYHTLTAVWNCVWAKDRISLLCSHTHSFGMTSTAHWVSKGWGLWDFRTLPTPPSAPHSSDSADKYFRPIINRLTHPIPGGDIFNKTKPSLHVRAKVRAHSSQSVHHSNACNVQVCPHNLTGRETA